MKKIILLLTLLLVSSCARHTVPAPKFVASHINDTYMGAVHVIGYDYTLETVDCKGVYKFEDITMSIKAIIPTKQGDVKVQFIIYTDNPLVMITEVPFDTLNGVYNEWHPDLIANTPIEEVLNGAEILYPYTMGTLNAFDYVSMHVDNDQVYFLLRNLFWVMKGEQLKLNRALK